MGVSTDAIIVYGIAFEEGFEFPWSSDEFEGDFESWWRHVSGYKPPFEIWGKHDRLPGITESQVSEYYDHQIAWEKANRPPVEPVSHCSGEYPMPILAVGGTENRAWRGSPIDISSPSSPLDIDINRFSVTKEQHNALLAFCNQHSIEATEPPRWWLCSYWG